MKKYYYFYSDGRLAGIYTSEQAAEVQRRLNEDGVENSADQPEFLIQGREA